MRGIETERFIPANASDILRRFRRGDWFCFHREKCSEKQNGRAPKLSVSETFTKNPGGERQRAGRTEKLEGLRERYANLADGNVVQDMGKGNASYGRKDQNEVSVRSRMKRSGDLSKRAGERKQQGRGDKTDQPETANRSKLRRGTFHEDSIERPAERGRERDE